VLISEGNEHILIDCGPDFRQQMLVNNIRSLTGILISHEHYDHISGLDDIRPFGNSDVYAEKRVIEKIRMTMPYCFSENKYPGVPIINLNEINENEFFIGNIRIQSIRVMHAKLPILGFRIGKMAYLTDVKTLPDESVEKLQGLDVLVINALRHQEHIAHLSLNEALEIAGKINAKETYFTHMSHDMGLHSEMNRLLPEHIQYAYDGLKLNI
jgi:phosphoribosyl 1,2-cyclic phosphate phosphodiesterase